MMKNNELVQKTHEELTKMAADARAEIRDMRFKVATRQFTKVRTVRNAKRDLARVMTALTSKKTS